MGCDDALILFVSTDCGACGRLLKTLAAKQTSDALSVPMFVAGRDVVSLPTSTMIALDNAGNMFDKLDVTVTPFVVAVRAGGVVYASTATTTDDVIRAGTVLASDLRRA